MEFLIGANPGIQDRGDQKAEFGDSEFLTGDLFIAVEVKIDDKEDEAGSDGEKDDVEYREGIGGKDLKEGFLDLLALLVDGPFLFPFLDLVQRKAERGVCLCSSKGEFLFFSILLDHRYGFLVL